MLQPEGRKLELEPRTHIYTPGWAAVGKVSSGVNMDRERETQFKKRIMESPDAKSCKSNCPHRRGGGQPLLVALEVGRLVQRGKNSIVLAFFPNS